jgi:hypothetical protein
VVAVTLAADGLEGSSPPVDARAAPVAHDRGVALMICVVWVTFRAELKKPEN